MKNRYEVSHHLGPSKLTLYTTVKDTFTDKEVNLSVGTTKYQDRLLWLRETQFKKGKMVLGK